MDKPRSGVEIWRFVALFYAIACGFSWIVWLPLIVGPGGLKLLSAEVSLPVFISSGTLGPLVACFITNRVQTGEWRAVRLLPQRGLRLAWLVLGPLIVLFCLFFIFPALISEGGPRAWHWRPSVLAGLWAPMFNYNLFGGPLFEEFGWRGYLQVRLQEALPPWIAAICVGLLWAAWHLPLFLVGWTSAAPPVFALIMVGLSLTMAFAFNSSGGAVVVAILMHSAFNASSHFLAAFLGNVATRTHPSAESLVGISFLLVGAAAVVFTRGRLGFSTN